MAKKILITNHFLREFSGSEIATLDITKEFLAKGYIVCVGTFIFHDPLKTEFDKLNVRLIDLNTASAEHFDLIWAHHFTTLDTCLIDIGITADKIIFSSLSPYESLESPPLSTEQVDLFLANSIETKDTLLDMGVDGAAIEILPNPVSDDFFTLTSNRDVSLQKIAIVSNHIPSEIKNTLPLLHNKGIEVKIFGIEGEFKLITPNILTEYDAVITIGRTVQYCLAMGIPVYCYDRFGGPGWITKSNIQKASEYNFSGRCTNRRLSSDDIANEIIQSFSTVQSEKDFYRQFALENYSLSRLVAIFVDKVSTSAKKIYSHKKDLYKNILKRQRVHLNNNSKLELFSQLFLDHGNGFSEENSIRFPVEQNDAVQRFEFDLNCRDGMKSLRLDPLNDSCVVEIEKLALIQKDGVEIDLIPYISANVCSHHGKAYFFEHFDPQIYFAGMEEGCFEDSVRLVFEARYAHISKDAVHVCVNQIANDRDHRVGVLNQEIENKNQEIENLKTELVSIYTSKSYKMTRPLRSLARSLRKIFR